MNILITGGAGFIGANLARHALDRGHEVRILDDLSTGYVDNLAGLRVDFLQASLLDVEALREAVRGIDSIVHLGALGSVPRSMADPLTTHHANATGSLNVLEAARANGVEHVVCASSSSVYGMNPALPKHEREWVRPMSPYGVSKLASEQYTLAYQQSYGMATLAFRFFNVFGPLQRAGHVYAAAIPIFIDALLRGAPLPINGDGTQSRDFTYVDTVCAVIGRAAGEPSRAGQPRLRHEYLGLEPGQTAIGGHRTGSAAGFPTPADWRRAALAGGRLGAAPPLPRGGAGGVRRRLAPDRGMVRRCSPSLAFLRDKRSLTCTDGKFSRFNNAGFWVLTNRPEV